MSTDYQWIKDYYKVPAEYGRLVTVSGKPGIIIKDMGNYIGVLFDDKKPNHILPCHPTSEVIYLGLGVPRKMTASQRRYLDYLEVSDCFDNFKDYLMHLAHKKKHPYLYQ